MIDLTIIIPTLNTSGEHEQDEKIRYALRECLLSLQETVPDIPIIVASNNGDPKPLPLETGTQVKRINVWEQGQCKAVNAAVAVTDTEWVMVSNDDMIYPPGWLARLRLWSCIGDRCYLNDNSYRTKMLLDFKLHIDSFGCLSPMLIEPNNGAPTFKEYFCGGAGGDFDKQKFLEFAENHSSAIIRKGFNLPFVIKREIWDLIGGYDINYDPWGSNGDSDLEYKLKLAGIQPLQQVDSIVYHFSQTSGTFHPSRQNYWNKNFAYFEEKWGFPRTDEGIWEATFEIPYEKLKFRPDWAKIPPGNTP